MESFFSSLSTIIQHATIQRVLSVGILIAILLLAFIVYRSADTVVDVIIPQKNSVAPITGINKKTEEMIDEFMKKNSDSVVFLSVLSLDLSRNRRTPIFRYFASESLRESITARLSGSDGSLPIFIKGDDNYNNQMIAILQGEMVCDSYTTGGLSRILPDLKSVIRLTCRVSIPPAFGPGTRGYIAIHMSRDLLPHELELIKLELKVLALNIDRYN